MKLRPNARSLRTLSAVPSGSSGVGISGVPAILVILTAVLTLGACASAGSDNSRPVSLTAATVSVSDQPEVASNELEKAMIRYAKCLREQGLDVPDPDFSRGYAGMEGYPFSDLDRNDPKVAEAIFSCQEAFIDVRVGRSGSGGS